MKIGHKSIGYAAYPIGRNYGGVWVRDRIAYRVYRGQGGAWCELGISRNEAASVLRLKRACRIKG